MFVCSKCDFEYEHSRSLRRHVKRCHPSVANILVPNKIAPKGEGQHLCVFCGKKFAYMSGLHKHQSDVHQRMPLRARVNINCSVCNFTTHTDKIMLEHLEKVHQIHISLEQHQFDSFTDFNSWRESVQNETNSSFIKHSGIKSRTDGTKVYTYHCHRSGKHISTSTGQRHLKKQGSCKLNAYCPAKIKMEMSKNGVCKVCFVSTHVGHNGELNHLRIKQREQIPSKTTAHVPMDTILDEVRYSIVNEIDRIHLDIENDLQNIEKSFNLNSDFMLYKDDGEHINAWVQEMQEGSNICVLFYKPPGEECPGLKVDDFALVIMNDTQCSMLQKYGCDCVCIDGTHDRNSYGYELITLLVLDELRQGFPCAFLISNRSDQVILSVFLEHIKKEVSAISPNVFMSDMDEAFYNAWCSIMGAPKHRLYCTWHIDRVWRKNLSKVAAEEKQIEVYKMIWKIMEETEMSTFSLILDEGVKILCDDPDTSEFGYYFKTCFVPCKEMWAYCYRKHYGLNTNVHIEAMHKTIKYAYLHGMSVKRVDKSIYAIMTLVRDKTIDRLVAIDKGKITSKIVDLRKRHKASATMSEVYVMVNGNSWEIISTSSTHEIYNVEQVLQSCDCKIICDECNACIHKYMCNCVDSAIKWNMCNHIHLVCRVQEKQNKHMDNDITESLLMDLEGPCEKEADKLIETLEKPVGTSSLEEKKRKLLQKFIQTINGTETDEELKAIEKQMAPIDAILAAIRKNTNTKFVNASSNCPTNKNISRQRTMKKSTKRLVRNISRSYSQGIHTIATNLQVHANSEEKTNSNT